MICASCGAENRDGARFCDSCGAALAEATPAREVRKVVTVLFCDVSGSTALGERIDPESLRRVMARYFETAKAIVERHGGTVEKFIGDAVMAVFGVPTVHEDDALRAVRAADELRGGAGRAERGAGAGYGTRLELRMGVNTGEVVTGTEERLATGDAVNVAARLEQAAQPGEVLLGEETYRLVRDGVEAEPTAPVEAKGKAEPLAAYRLVSVQAEAPGRRHEAPMVGREQQRELLEGAFANVVERPLVPPLHDPRRRGRRQVAAGAGVPRRRGRDRRQRPLPLLRRRHQLLARDGGRQAARLPAGDDDGSARVDPR